MPRRKEDILDRVLNSFSLRGFLLHQATLFIAATALMIGGVIYLWNNNRATIVDIDAYQLTAEKIYLPSPPPWVNFDPKQMLLGETSLPSILDPTLVGNTAQQIERMKFIDQLHLISKSKSGLKIDLDYRVPVAIVEVNARTMRTDSNTPNSEVFKNLKLPIDRTATVMPAELAGLPNLPLISLPQPVDPTYPLELWGLWPDQRVRDAALIGKLFAFRPEYGVFRIVTFQGPGDSAAPKPFELWGPSGEFGMRIIWGSHSDDADNEEASTAQKLAAIDELIKRVGPLVPVTGQRHQNRLGRVFDVRSGRAIEVPTDKVAKMPTFESLSDVTR